MIHWTFRNCDAKKEEARTYLNSKVRRVIRRLARLGAEDARLELTLYFHSGRDSFELRAVLRLPAGTLVASEEQRDLRYVIDEVVDELTRQLRKHKARMRREHVTRRRREREQELATATPYLQQDVEQDRKEDFFDLLSPLLDSVREHAEYELDILEVEEVIPAGELTVDELVDEVILLAYDRFRLRPPESLMEVWLMELLQERLRELTPLEPPLSLANPSEVELDPDDDEDVLDFEDVKYWMSHAVGSNEFIGIEELVADEDEAKTLRTIEQEEEQRQLKQLLNKLPKCQRQAIMLHEASGFDMPEVARMLQVSESDIQQFIEKATRTLRKHLASFANDSKQASSPKQ